MSPEPDDTARASCPVSSEAETAGLDLALMVFADNEGAERAYSDAAHAVTGSREHQAPPDAQLPSRYDLQRRRVWARRSLPS